MTSENNLPDIDALLRTHANDKADRMQRLEVAKWFRELQYQNYLARLDAEIADMEAVDKEREAALKQTLADYVADTGDLKPHEMVTVRRTDPLRYDKDEALAWVTENAPHLLRVKKELDVRKFEDAVKAGHLKWDGAEQTNEVVIVVGKLGHMVDQKSEDGE
jgi:hypothetical protein